MSLGSLINNVIIDVLTLWTYYVFFVVNRLPTSFGKKLILVNFFFTIFYRILITTIILLNGKCCVKWSFKYFCININQIRKKKTRSVNVCNKENMKCLHTIFIEYTPAGWWNNLDDNSREKKPISRLIYIMHYNKLCFCSWLEKKKLDTVTDSL